MYADDVWLKVMELISGVPVVQVQTRLLDRYDEAFAIDGLYQKHNGNGGNDAQFQKVLKLYNNFDESGMELIEKIFSSGIVFENEVAGRQEEDNSRMAQEWLNRVSINNNIVIYGAGTVAKRIYALLKKQNITEKIKCFAVEDTDKNVKAIEGIKVVKYTTLDYTNAICIIALGNLEERYYVSNQLQELGLDEDRILLLNNQLHRALYNLWKKYKNI